MGDKSKPGATPSDDQTDDQTDDQQDRQDRQDRTDDVQIDGLGDAGKEAIRREREAARKADESRKAIERDLRAAQKRLKEFEDADKSESEKLAGERDTWQKSATDYRDRYRRVNAAELIRTKALDLGADPRRVDRIVRMVRPDVEYGDDGDDPTNVDALVTALKKSDADLFAPVVGKGDGGAGGSGKPKQGTATAILRKHLYGERAG